jgi:deoxyribonuclease-4
MSVAGGYHNALLTARNHDCPAVQLFTKNANQWAARPLAEDQVRLFRRTLRETKIKQTIAHDSYLINLASPKEDLFRKSVEAFVIEMERAEALGLRYLVAHPGSHAGTDEDTGLLNVARALDEVQQRCAGFRVRILLETTAGQGQSLGHRFEQLARILDTVAEPGHLGVCFDTCHVFAAGYPLAPEADYRATMAAFDQLIGLKRLRVFHVNDSKKPLGSRVDRHAHIGRGCLGLEPFRLLVNDSRFRDCPMILETPKEEDGQDMDAANLAVLRGLVSPGSCNGAAPCGCGETPGEVRSGIGP